MATRTSLNHVVTSVRATSLEELLEDTSQLTVQAAHLVVSQGVARPSRIDASAPEHLVG